MLINSFKRKSNLKHIKDLDDLKKQAVFCTLCKIYKSLKSPIFGVGNKKAKIMFIGEAPGATEEIQGEPFVGRAGKLLNTMLKSIGLSREDIYITNILKCRPPENKAPLLKEIKSCFPYLLKEISLVQPKIIVALGRIAAQFLLNTKIPMRNLRGRIFRYGTQKIILLVTYHPAYLLRVPGEKKRVEEDFLKIKKILISNSILYKSKAGYLIDRTRLPALYKLRSL